MAAEPTSREFDIMKYFCKECNKVFDKSQVRLEEITYKNSGQIEEKFVHQINVRYLKMGISQIETRWHIVEEVYDL